MAAGTPASATPAPDRLPLASGLLFHSVFCCGNITFSHFGAHHLVPLFPPVPLPERPLISRFWKWYAVHLL